MNKATLQSIHEHLLVNLKKIEEDINFHEQLRSGFFKFANPEQESSIGNWVHGKRHGNKVASLKKKKKVLHTHIREVKNSIRIYGMIQNMNETMKNYRNKAVQVEPEIEEPMYEKTKATDLLVKQSFFAGAFVGCVLLAGFYFFMKNCVIS